MVFVTMVHVVSPFWKYCDCVEMVLVTLQEVSTTLAEIAARSKQPSVNPDDIRNNERCFLIVVLFLKIWCKDSVKVTLVFLPSCEFY
jgi:hypothetical protein